MLDFLLFVAGSSLSFEQQRIKDKLQELGLTFIQPPPYLSRPEQPLARGTLSISISRFDVNALYPILLYTHMGSSLKLLPNQRGHNRLKEPCPQKAQLDTTAEALDK